MVAAKERDISNREAENSFWETHKPPTDLIFDDGEPMESNRHRMAMNVLIDSIDYFLAKRSDRDYFVGGNMFVYYNRNQVKNQDFRGPDFFVVLDVDRNQDRKGWVVWDENGRYPDVIVELMSPSTAKVDKTQKKDIYEGTFHTADYFIFDPFNADSLQGWHLDENQRYKALEANERGWLYCQKLDLWLGLWEGIISDVEAKWLRFYEPNGNLVLLPSEAAQQQAQAAQQQAQAAQQQAQIERERAMRLEAKLRELGENPDLI